MKKKRWKIKTHYCARFVEITDLHGRPPLRSCVKCLRIQNWQDVYPVGR